MTAWIATRAAGLARMEEFGPRMGRRYASGRNYDRGPGKHSAVSGLSPYLRRRLITEREVVGLALDQHGPEGAEKFIQEVVWRGYFKGWLERRPSIWADYRRGLDADRAALDRDRRLRKAVEAAEAGQSGLDCVDGWARELVETGYLHNHARMWFASIWVFTLELPWRLGADFFLRHLLDGDPASNTLGWRWVAGLHTRGKAYQAKAWNIAKFTDGRVHPRDADLAAGIRPLEFTEPEGLPQVAPLRAPVAPATGTPTALLIAEDECKLEDFQPERLDLVGAATLAASHLRSDAPVGDGVVDFETSALADAAERLGLEATAMRAGSPADLVRWAKGLGAAQIASGYVPTGPLRDWLDEAAPALAEAGITLTEWRRDWDAQVWPHATAGFFKVKKIIPRLIHQLDLAA
ncbi:MAG: FAD-binding domain-containing protein [Cyanobacteria bacterium P01_F01_bin.150]